ncbi:MAG: UDPglucose 6-dehydrogenase [Francisellaceae bacterium]
MFSYISKHFKLDRYPDAIKGKTFALWGLSFKPNTDEMRAASSLVLMASLWAAGAKVQAYEPEAMEETQRICTEWKNFRAPNFELIKEKLNTNALFDGRNMFEPSRMAENGFAYYCIGRGLSVVGY